MRKAIHLQRDENTQVYETTGNANFILLVYIVPECTMMQH